VTLPQVDSEHNIIDDVDRVLGLRPSPSAKSLSGGGGLTVSTTMPAIAGASTASPTGGGLPTTTRSPRSRGGPVVSIVEPAPATDATSPSIGGVFAFSRIAGTGDLQRQASRRKGISVSRVLNPVHHRIRRKESMEQLATIDKDLSQRYGTLRRTLDRVIELQRKFADQDRRKRLSSHG
jgi:hypothetical protein